MGRSTQAEKKSWFRANLEEGPPGPPAGSVLALTGHGQGAFRVLTLCTCQQGRPQAFWLLHGFKASVNLVGVKRHPVRGLSFMSLLSNQVSMFTGDFCCLVCEMPVRAFCLFSYWVLSLVIDGEC